MCQRRLDTSSSSPDFRHSTYGLIFASGPAFMAGLSDSRNGPGAIRGRKHAGAVSGVRVLRRFLDPESCRQFQVPPQTAASPTLGGIQPQPEVEGRGRAAASILQLAGLRDSFSAAAWLGTHPPETKTHQRGSWSREMRATLLIESDANPISLRQITLHCRVI
jgi:hypothetical protein